jgi:hypothetical protein
MTLFCSIKGDTSQVNLIISLLSVGRIDLGFLLMGSVYVKSMIIDLELLLSS